MSFGAMKREERSRCGLKWPQRSFAGWNAVYPRAHAQRPDRHLSDAALLISPGTLNSYPHPHASNTIPLAVEAGHWKETRERWQATRIGLNANCRTFMRAFIVAASLVEMNSTVRLSPPAFIPAQSAAMMDRSISSFETWMPPRLAQMHSLPAVQQANAVLRCCGDCALTSLRPAARTNSLVNRFLSSARIANLVTSFGCSSVNGRIAISALEILHAASRVKKAAPLCANTSDEASSAVVKVCVSGATIFFAEASA